MLVDAPDRSHASHSSHTSKGSPLICGILLQEVATGTAMGLIHGNPETLMEWIRQAGDTELRIRQVEQSEHRWNRTQRQPLRTPENWDT
uniref:Uncharacterized protein n=1 Tax=Sphaerodactylus townsendi TaxID=933632 RepID=A0ACB8E669_9SAUR